MPPPRWSALWHSANRLALRPSRAPCASFSSFSSFSSLTPSSAPTSTSTTTPTSPATASTRTRSIRPSRPQLHTPPVRGYSATTPRDSDAKKTAAGGYGETRAGAAAADSDAILAELGTGSGSGSAENQVALRHLELLSQGLAPFDVHSEGHKFGLTVVTTRPAAEAGQPGSLDQKLPGIGKLHDRYDPVVTHMTRVLMRDGKLAKAQRDMAMILNYLKTAPPPKFNPARPLTPGHPSALEMSLDPVRYLTVAIESVAPLIRIRSFAGAAGGGRPLLVPDPLVARQRRRRVFAWLFEVVNKKPSRGSGRGMLAQRVAEEIIAIVEGRSVLWEKRMLLHKQGISTRANLARLDMLIKMGQV